MVFNEDFVLLLVRCLMMSVYSVMRHVMGEPDIIASSWYWMCRQVWMSTQITDKRDM